MIAKTPVEKALLDFVHIIDHLGGVKHDGHWRLANFPADDTGLATCYIRACEVLKITPTTSGNSIPRPVKQ